MDNSCRIYPERLGYCFHSNGFEKKRCVSGNVAKNALRSFIDAKLRRKSVGRWSKQQKYRCKLTTEEKFNEMTTFLTVY